MSSWNSIFTTIRSLGRSFNGLNQVGQLVVTVALVFIAFSFGNCKSNDKLDSFIIEYNEYKKNAEKTIEFADSLKTTVDKLTDDVRLKEDKIKKLAIGITDTQKQKQNLKQKLTSLESRIEVTTDTAKILTLKDSVINNLKIQVTTTETIVEEKDKIIELKTEQLVLMTTSLQLSTQRGDSLQKTLLSLPPTPKNPNKLFGMIPLPSRKTVAIGALLSGIVIGVVTTK
jgi:hypothetical protein